MSAAFDREQPVCKHCGKPLTVGEQCGERETCEGCEEVRGNEEPTDIWAENNE